MKMFDSIEYVDPGNSECPECKSSFGVHLTTCKYFIPGKLNPVPPKTKEEDYQEGGS